MRITSENIQTLKHNQIFCFGSNYKGNHGKGAALSAKNKFGAIQGIGEGLQGQSYGIPTKAYDMRGRLSIPEIKKHVDKFIEFSKTRPDLIFLVTEIGCGEARYTVEEIAPLFLGAKNLENIFLPERFWKVIT